MPVPLDLFELYLISSSFPGILNTQNKSWYILFEHFDIVIGERIFTVVLLSQLLLYYRHACCNLWINVNVKCVCVISVHSFMLFVQPYFHLFIKTSQLLAYNSLILPTASYSLQLLSLLFLKYGVTLYWKIKLNCYIIAQQVSSSIT